MKLKAIITAYILIASSPINALEVGDVYGRQLYITGLGWIGHIGASIARIPYSHAGSVVEVLNNETNDNVIYFSDPNYFMRSEGYWGRKYGFINTQSQAFLFNDNAFYQKSLCTRYTTTRFWWPAQGGYDKPICGKFRCDTFINYLYFMSGERLATYNGASLPLYVYNEIPYKREDHLDPYNPPQFKANYKPAYQYELKLVNYSDKQLNDMDIGKFMELCQLDENLNSNAALNRMTNLARNGLLKDDKRKFLLDLLGFKAKPSFIKSCINIFKTNKNPEIKLQALILTQDIYQRYDNLDKYPEEKLLLSNFYLERLKDPEKKESAIIILGVKSLLNSNDIINNLNKINSIIYSMDDDGMTKSLIWLAHKSPELQDIYIPKLIDHLKKINDREANDIFVGAIAHSLAYNGLNFYTNKSKHQISLFLRNENQNIYKNGRYLEAQALIQARSYRDAVNYISDRLSNLADEQKTLYILELSSSTYMKEAFNTNTVLNKFKLDKLELYNRTIGKKN